MEWLDQHQEFRDSDLKVFDFCPNQLRPGSCEIETVELRRDDAGSLYLHGGKCSSEKDFLDWMNKIQLKEDGTQQTELALVMHPQLAGRNHELQRPMKSSSLPYKQDTFQKCVEHMFQHGSISHAFERKSTAIFTSRENVSWASRPSWGPSIVYHCRSDNQSDIGNNEFALSATSFVEIPLTFAVMYGSTQRTRNQARDFIKRFVKSKRAMHPLLLPMMFAEIERKRFFIKHDNYNDSLDRRFLEMENKIENKIRFVLPKDKEKNRDTDVKDASESAKLGISLAQLRNGMSSMNAQLGFMLDHYRILPEIFPGQALNGDLHDKGARHTTAWDIERRLKEIIAEFDSKIGNVDATLKGLELISQAERSYYAKEDNNTARDIASSTMKDSNQMRMIAFLGMFFLPGTFLTTLFSTGLFKWIPDNSNQVVSPWVALWAGLTILLTGGTVILWREWIGKRITTGREVVQKKTEQEKNELDSASSMV